METKTQQSSELNFVEKRFDIEENCFVTAWGRPLKDLPKPSSVSELALDGIQLC